MERCEEETIVTGGSCAMQNCFF
ncbi:unnamed protein product [Spirodela intermedia]|uniref:Uncharacterized protein n=2 Tax=Spirodela intermedia TaxID=51605 RepID=A0A7I8KQF0_SPIIN|nr:unnamed protein product [Spirodela intermedia]CAA6663582.1 unnamed protein product [Spirodela intermedia]CAA7400069.1 unnamed protein product [Spirodela intermedia]